MPVRSYLDLHDTEFDHTDTLFMPSLTDSLTQVFEFLEDGGELTAASPWGLAPEVDAALSERAGYTPTGGWSALVGLAVGAQIFEATRKKFTAATTLAELVTLDEHTLRRRLLEATTTDLVPPAFVASFGVLLGLHPAWMLRVAYSVRGDVPEARSTWRDEASFPPERIEEVRNIFFDALACVVAALRSLHPGTRYDVDALARFAHDVAQETTRVARGGRAPGLNLFVRDAGTFNHHARQLVNDLLDLVLVPAGAARRFDDQTFCVLAGAFDQVHVDALDADAQRRRLAQVLPADSVAS